MKRMAAAMITVFMFMANGAAGQKAPAAAQNPQAISIARSGSLQSTKGSAQYFTGTVQIQQLFAAHDPSRTSGGSVTFEPGARSAWHTHPFGQILIAVCNFTASQGKSRPNGSSIDWSMSSALGPVPPKRVPARSHVLTRSDRSKSPGSGIRMTNPASSQGASNDNLIAWSVARDKVCRNSQVKEQFDRQYICKVRP
jgi:hypothetical protein